MNEELCSFIVLAVLLVTHLLPVIKIGIKLVGDTRVGNYFGKWYVFVDKWSDFGNKWSKLAVL
jgi:hypothetical protein